MKKFNLILLSILGIFAFASCEEGKVGPVASSDPGSPEITAPESGENYILTEEEAADTLMTIEWTTPDYGFPSAPEFIIQMDSAGNDFSDPMELGSVQGNSYSLTVGDMNGILLGADFPGGEEVGMDVRVQASLSDSMDTQVSEAISLAFTPYSTCNFCPAIYVPGGYQGWDPATAPALNTVSGKDVYEGYVNIADANSEFKFTAERNWANGDWGTSGTEGELESPGSNIVAEEAGYYKINVDLNNMSYSMLNTQWGIIGDATANGWDSDQDMTYDSETQVWTITADLTVGEMKFRANDAWNLDYGDNEGDGTLEQGGGNIAVDEAGNYTITLDLSEFPYIYELNQN